MLLLIRHLTEFSYAEGAAGVALRLRLFPPTFPGQRVVDWQVEVDGAIVEPSIVGGYGERFAQWLCRERRDRIEVIAHGCVETEDTAGIVTGLRRAAPPGVFLRDTPLTTADDAIVALGEGLEGGADTLTALHALSARIRETLPYRPGVTDSRTPAAAALAGGAGVCQDHAHIFIAAARARGVPARYVVGYLLAAEDETQQVETHAWGEAHVDGLGWIGFDVSNGVCPTDHYVRLCTGLDADDAAPIRGLVTGGGSGTVVADVRIARSDNGEAAQQQQQQQQRH